MKTKYWGLLVITAAALIFPVMARAQKIQTATVPFILDHNRMIVEAEIKQKDGRWIKARLWVDTGNPDFLIGESLARELGIDVEAAKAGLKIETPTNVRLGGMPLNFDGAKSSLVLDDRWLFKTMHNDGNLPSKVLKKYQVVFDYPSRRLTIAEPGILKPRGIPSPIHIHPTTGIIQMDAAIDGEKYSFALDNGASFSYVPAGIVAKLSQRHADWPQSLGAVGCANIWGWWPEEEQWPMIRIPKIEWGSLTISDAVIAGLPPFFSGNKDLAAWYSLKTAEPVDGFFGPNIFKAFRIEIVYPDNIAYFERGPAVDVHDMDILGLTMRPLNDGRYQVIGVVLKNEKPLIDGIKPGDILLQVDDLKTTGATMGMVIDAIRGKPGDKRVLKLERDGKAFTIEARVERIL